MSDDKHLAALRDYYKGGGAFPSMPRLCLVLGLSSTSSVFALIGRPSSSGYLDRVAGRVVPTKKFFARPLLGDQPNRTSLHKVRGDSMRDAGILGGDLVAVEQNAPAAPATSCSRWTVS